MIERTWTDRTRDITGRARFDTDEVYRYELERRWGDDVAVMFLMLNPSTATERIVDPTVNRCIGYATDWGYGTLLVGNIFSLRATDPKELYKAADPIGPETDWHLLRMAQRADLVVAAWGAHGLLYDRGNQVAEMLIKAGVTLRALATTSSGQPRHPLYLKRALTPRPYRGAVEEGLPA